MKAAVYYPGEGIRIDERAIPQPEAGQLLIEVKATGICGSDLHYYRDGHIGDWWIRQPHVLGHEFAGVVADVGDGVAEFAVGDRVAVEPIVPCDSCIPCNSGLYNLCSNLRFTGSPHIDGALQEYVIARPRFTHRVPDDMTFALAALVEPTSIAVHAVRRAQLQQGDSVMVVGAGPIGLLTAAVARAHGADPVYISDINAYRLGRAQEVGVTAVIETDGSAVHEVWRLTDGRGVDLVFEAVGNPGTLDSALQMVRPGGRLVLVGVNPEEKIMVNVMLAQSKEVSIVPVYLGRGAFPEAIDLLASGRVNGDALLTHRFPLTQVVSAMELAASGRHDAIKVTIDLATTGEQGGDV